MTSAGTADVRIPSAIAPHGERRSSWAAKGRGPERFRAARALRSWHEPPPRARRLATRLDTDTYQYMINLRSTRAARRARRPATRPACWQRAPACQYIIVPAEHARRAEGPVARRAAGTPVMSACGTRALRSAPCRARGMTPRPARPRDNETCTESPARRRFITRQNRRCTGTINRQPADSPAAFAPTEGKRTAGASASSGPGTDGRGATNVPCHAGLAAPGRQRRERKPHGRRGWRKTQLLGC